MLMKRCRIKNENGFILTRSVQNDPFSDTIQDVILINLLQLTEYITDYGYK